MRFNPIDGTPEQKARLLECEQEINELLYNPAFENEVSWKVLHQLRKYHSADVTFFFRDSTVAGMANEELNLIRLNTKIFGKQFDRDCATLVHEWLHLLGYDHEGSKDYASIPYSVGFISEKIIREGNNPKVPVWKWVLGGFALAIILYFLLR